MATVATRRGLMGAMRLASTSLSRSSLAGPSTSLAAAPVVEAPLAGVMAGGLQGELNPFGARFASQLIVKTRMKSVKNIQKITKAMKMVAASKLRIAQVAAEGSRGVWQPAVRMLGDFTGVDVKNNLTVVLSSDRGLCGGINSTVVKYTRGVDRIVEHNSPDHEVALTVIGEKAKAQLQRDSAKYITMTATDVTKVPTTFALASELTDEIVAANKFDAARIIFNRFQSAISFQPVIVTVLSPDEISRDARDNEELNGYHFVGGPKEAVVQDLAEFQFATVLFNGLLENFCCEQGSRMSAMDNSTRNATDMLEALTLQYNRSRQASITTELIEIISGAAALEG